MSFFENPPLQDFPDRAIRRLLEDPRNLRELLAVVVPDLVDRFDFERAELVQREFLMEDWRRREADLLFRIPLRDEDGGGFALVCVLVEHQSEPDPRMPLRTLLYAVLYWDQEWRRWEGLPSPKDPLRLTPVLPIVFHTGAGVWRANPTLADLIAGPEELRVFAPHWSPLFWDLAEQSSESLLERTEAWLQALAVVRAEHDPALGEVLAGVLRRLEPVRGREEMRWRDLVWFVLSWILQRRPRDEARQLLATVQASMAGPPLQGEVEEMTETIGQTLTEWAEGRGEARGEARTRREDLVFFLEKRFGTLSNELRARIEAVEDPDRLKAAMLQVFDLKSPADLKL